MICKAQQVAFRHICHSTDDRYAVYNYCVQAVHDSLLRTLKETAERLGQNRSLLLIGPSGCGKTLVRTFKLSNMCMLACLGCTTHMKSEQLPKLACASMPTGGL